jgi:hypothetical protein
MELLLSLQSRIFNPSYVSLLTTLSFHSSVCRDFFLPQIFPQIKTWLSSTNISDLLEAAVSFVYASCQFSGFDNCDGFAQFTIDYLLEHFHSKLSNFVFLSLLGAIEAICFHSPQYCEYLLNAKFPVILKEIFQFWNDRNIIIIALKIGILLAKWDAERLDFTLEIFHDLGLHGDSKISILTFKLLNQIVSKTKTGLIQDILVSSDILEFIQNSLQNATFSVKMTINLLLQNLVNHWSVVQQFKVASQYDFISILFEMLDDIENSKDRQVVLMTLKSFLHSGISTDLSENCFFEVVSECNGFDILEKWRIQGTELEWSLIDTILGDLPKMEHNH